MIPEIVWTAGAEADLRKAYNRLETNSKGSGEKFILAVDGALTLLPQFPFIAPVYDAPLRRLVIHNTHYGIFYAIEARGIIIHLVIDLRADPARITERLKGE